MAEENSELREMSDAVAEQVSFWVQEASEPAEPGEHISQRIRRSARRLKLTESQTKRLWYRELKRIPADLYLSVQDRMHEIADHQARLLEARMEVTEARRRAYERKQAAVADLFEPRN